MRYFALATDYDGTLATDGQADAAALSAIERLRISGRRVILLTGRQVDDLLSVCPRLRLFDYVVAENGAVLYDPRTREIKCLGDPPPGEFIERLAELTGTRSRPVKLLSAPGCLIKLQCSKPFRKSAWSFRLCSIKEP